MRFENNDLARSEGGGILRGFFSVDGPQWLARLPGTELIARHDAAAGREAAVVVRAGLAAQILPALEAVPPETIARVEERVPSVARYAVGMSSPKVRTALRSGEISRWDLDRLCAVAASLRHTVHPVLVPAGMKAIVTFEPA